MKSITISIKKNSDPIKTVLWGFKEKTIKIGLQHYGWIFKKKGSKIIIQGYGKSNTLDKEIEALKDNASHIKIGSFEIILKKTLDIPSAGIDLNKNFDAKKIIKEDSHYWKRYFLLSIIVFILCFTFSSFYFSSTQQIDDKKVSIANRKNLLEIRKQLKVKIAEEKSEPVKILEKPNIVVNKPEKISKKTIKQSKIPNLGLRSSLSRLTSLDVDIDTKIPISQTSKIAGSKNIQDNTSSLLKQKINSEVKSTNSKLQYFNEKDINNKKEKIKNLANSGNYLALSPSDANIDSGLTQEQVGKTIRKHIDEVNFCHKNSLENGFLFRGKVTIGFTINENGYVTTARIIGKNVAVGVCIAEQLKNWRFPKPTGTSRVQVKFPFVFSMLDE